MGQGINKCTFLGNLGADPELRMTAAGQAILKLRLACTESYMDKQSNERKERTEWISCTLWGKRGEALAKFLKKGSQVYVEGSLRTTSYEKNGEKRYSTDINVTEIIVCGGRSADDAPRAPAQRQGFGPPAQRAPANPSPAPQDDYGSGDFGDDEIPF